MRHKADSSVATEGLGPQVVAGGHVCAQRWESLERVHVQRETRNTVLNGPCGREAASAMMKGEETGQEDPVLNEPTTHWRVKQAAEAQRGLNPTMSAPHLRAANWRTGSRCGLVAQRWEALN